ncbi:uncharacterized protein LOC132544600 [Ylistrum balloti]|uniref:uncharacterized protein LOC132544600 n=1 Tax=Ylistrum balloti TaxID=509963 RepID=UPI002905F678|nr:uncharacterized protein LOC132544600 [Ylistrum balloti]XP_060064201.1 uncharacterized protein LOC132544600 [Ylistrum balloti]XP_060064202.1 uncharacterized protein LOC132544600 [Ylistrum balloti]
MRLRIEMDVKPSEMAATDRLTECLAITNLPSVVVTHMLSFLSWEDKLNVIIAIPQWCSCFRAVAAWKCVEYGNEMDENMYFLKEKRTKFLFCIKQYGKYMRSIKLIFGSKLSHMAIKIMHAVSEFCSHLTYFHIGQEVPLQVDESLVWRKSVVNGICSILQNCNQLNSVSICQPVIDWTESPDNNIILNIIQQGLAHKITNLELNAESLWEHEGYQDFLKNFTHLKRLVTRRENITDEILLVLAQHKLEEVTLVQEEEIPLQQQEHLKEGFWTKVLNICPTFQIDMILRYIMVIKDSFPAMMPLRKLILDDLVNIVTKGVLEHLTENYKDCLEHFTYTNSLLENYETGDRRLPSSLVNMAMKCTKLRSLQYGFPLSSTSILLLARARKLEKLLIQAVEVSYEYDWQTDPNWSSEFVAWLKASGKNERTLELAVSEILGFKWKLSYDPFTLDEQLNTMYM